VSQASGAVPLSIQRATEARSIAPAPEPVSEVERLEQPASELERPEQPVSGLERLERPAYLGVRPRARSLSLALRVSVPLALFVFWWYGTSSGAIPESVLASPSQVVGAFLELYQSGQLKEFVLASLSRAVFGVGLGVTIGLLLGVAAGFSAAGEELVDPTMQMLRAVPFLALVPLFISWFGIDERFKIVLIAASSTMPMYAYSYLGVRSVDRKVVEAARGFGLRRAGLLFRVILPAALPNLLMALRICLAISVVGLIAAEQVGTTRGIGYLVLLAKQYYRQDYMLLCVILYAALGLVFDAFIRLLERTTMPWRRHIAVRG
jgi:sulfonate transport system permease protein